MARNKKETSTEVKKENKKKGTKKAVELKGRANTKSVTPKIPLSGTITAGSSTGFTFYENGNIDIKNNSGNSAITDIEKLPFTNPEFPNMWGGGQVGYIAPVKLKEDTLLTFLNSIESELIELNNKMGELASRNVNNLYNLTYQELFEIKKHLAETVQKHHYPGSTGNIYMMQAQRRYEIIVSEINNKLNVLFGDV